MSVKNARSGQIFRFKATGEFYICQSVNRILDMFLFSVEIEFVTCYVSWHHKLRFFVLIALHSFTLEFDFLFRVHFLYAEVTFSPIALI